MKPDGDKWTPPIPQNRCNRCAVPSSPKTAKRAALGGWSIFGLRFRRRGSSYKNYTALLFGSGIKISEA